MNFLFPADAIPCVNAGFKTGVACLTQYFAAAGSDVRAWQQATIEACAQAIVAAQGRGKLFAAGMVGAEREKEGTPGIVALEDFDQCRNAR